MFLMFRPSVEEEVTCDQRYVTGDETNFSELSERFQNTK
jgi:hypothetical protein